METDADNPDTETTAPAASTTTRTFKRPPIRVKLGRILPNCKCIRGLIVEGAIGIKPELMTEVDSIMRAIDHLRGIHPPPTLEIDGQTYPMVIEGSPRSPRLMMEDRGDFLRLYFEVGGAAVARVWGLPGPYIVFRGRVVQLEWSGAAEDIDPLLNGPVQVAKRLLVREPWRSVLAHAGQVPPQAEKAKAVRGRPQPILRLWEIDSRLCGQVSFRYHEDLPVIDPRERIGLIVAEKTTTGELIKCERDRDLEFQRCNEFIKRGALVQRRGAFGFVADGDAADRFLAQVVPVLQQTWEIPDLDKLHRGRPPKEIEITTEVITAEDGIEVIINAEVEGRNVPVKELLAVAGRGQK